MGNPGLVTRDVGSNNVVGDLLETSKSRPAT